MDVMRFYVSSYAGTSWHYIKKSYLCTLVVNIKFMSDSDKDSMGKKKWQMRFPAVSLKSVVLFFLLVFVVYFIFFDEHNLMSRFRNKHKIEVLTKEIEHYRKETETNRQKMNELKSNNRNLEKFAREQYYMKRTNEDVYIIKE